MEISERVSVMVEASALQRTTSKSASILGPVWLRHDSVGSAPTDFPETQWSDFVVIILAWWFEGVRELHRGAAEVELRFMDGPLLFRVALEEPMRYKISCIINTLQGEDSFGEWRTSRAHFDASLHEAALAILAECNHRGWKSRDVDVLQAAVRSARVQVAV
jgi:hypothetical protein